MTEQQRNDIVAYHSQGRSQRAIARVVGVSRRTVRRVLEQLDAQRREGAPHPELPRPRRRRESLLDRYDDMIKESLEQYPELTAVRLHEELRARGFGGGYTIVKQRLRELRPSRLREPVVRFETAPGAQAQMDYSTYMVPFTSGARRVHAFSYLLGYSRRQYVRFVERQDMATTLREHISAFRRFGGLARTCLYDNMRVVVTSWEDGQPVYNRRFLGYVVFALMLRTCWHARRLNAQCSANST